MHDTEDPIVQAQQMIAEARQAFANDVDATLAHLGAFSASLGVGADESIRILRAVVLEKFAQRVAPTRSLSEVLLRQAAEENTALRATQAELLEALKTARCVLQAACGTTAPYIREAFKVIDPAIEKAEGADA